MAAAPVEIGALIAGKYRIERVLGHGGMGVVVVAMHDELDQRVAIKFLLPEAASDAEWVARFSREARAAARIKSEHAVKVYDVGKLDNGAPFMVMEYLEGRDLQQILQDRERLPISEAVDYLLQACEAIAEAHVAGIVHRDLKPANLFLMQRTDGSPCVKILDFGISKVAGSRDQTVTSTAAIVGSPLYMSPEQMKASKNVDRRTDIWSLGVILQELVSGLPSFVADTAAELCALVLTSAPTPLRQTSSEAPVELEVVIQKCLQKAPADRFADVAELAHALEPFGPASVKTSVERITRLAASKPVTKTANEPSAPVREEPAPRSIVIPAGQTNVSSLGQTVHDSDTTRHEAPPATVHDAGTSAAWGGSQTVKRGSRRMTLFVGGGAVLALGVLGIAFAVARANRPAAPLATVLHSDGPSSAAPGRSEPTVAVTAPTAQSIETTAPTAKTEPAKLPVEPAHSSRALTGSVASAAHVEPAASTKKPPSAAPLDTSGFGGRN